MRPIPITVIIPVRNEEANLAQCLSRLRRFVAVVVVDSSSTDRTLEIARAYGATVIEFHWNGRYPKKRNWTLMEHPPSTSWVLFLDADEFIDDHFCEAVAAAITDEKFDGFWLNYANYFLGRRLRYGLPQRKLALFRVGKALYERIDEQMWSELDMEIHEHPLVEGQVGEINIEIEHNDFRGINKFIDRHGDYAMWEACRVLVLEREGRISGDHLTRRQRFKYANLEQWWYPWFYFVYTYVWKLGLLDGAPGFQYAFYKTWYFLTIRIRIGELRKAVNDRTGLGHLGL